MTREEAIEKFERQLSGAMVVLDSGFGTRPGENNRLYRERKEMAEIALAALRAQQEAEKNKPLTLDELREMVGEPVWVEYLRLRKSGEWEIISGIDDISGCVYLVSIDQPDDYGTFDTYGDSWLAYRRKPEKRTMLGCGSRAVHDGPYEPTTNALESLAAHLKPIIQEDIDAKDDVNHPAHYTQGGIECIDAIKAATVGLEGIEAVLTGNVIKYVWRWKRKGGVEDIDKAIWYLNRLKEELETGGH